ncbi:Uncharacterised protein [Mycobacteroides abscessus subsp. massiliense]|nr:Uncharacterised protein [Mycobacteroides abscessus subsp. massiliense]
MTETAVNTFCRGKEDRRHAATRRGDVLIYRDLAVGVEIGETGGFGGGSVRWGAGDEGCNGQDSGRRICEGFAHYHSSPIGRYNWRNRPVDRMGGLSRRGGRL